jgi:hypothetical protein
MFSVREIHAVLNSDACYVRGIEYEAQGKDVASDVRFY